MSDARQALSDWELYGPRDGEIFKLVERLVEERGWTLGQIETRLKRSLIDALAEPSR